MSTELATLQAAAGNLQKYDDKSFDNLSTGGSFLPRFQLFGANSGEVKRGKIPMAHFGLVRGKDNVEDLGAEVNILILAWRPKAMKIGEDEIISLFDVNSDAFRKIQADSEVQDSGCMFGPEFLIWCPSSGTPCFATYFLNSKTARREAPNMKALLLKSATCKAQLIETKKYSWHGPVVVACSAPFALPSMEEISSQAERFNNPPAKDVEKAEDSGDRAR